MKKLPELQNDELLNINGGANSLTEGTEYWPASSKNPVVAVANVAYNTGVIIGNAASAAWDWITE